MEFTGRTLTPEALKIVSTKENSKDAIAALHTAQVLSAAQALFQENGSAQTTIEDISAASTYSRHTIYACFFQAKRMSSATSLRRGLKASGGTLKAR